jgi:hypothetical protein
MHRHFINYFFALVIISLSSVEMKAQNISTDTIRWNATGFTDVLANVTVQKPCQFVAYKTSKIDWLQNNGTVVFSIVVNSVEGTWVNVNEDGTITYNVQLDGLLGKITIVRTGQSIKLIMDMHGDADDIKNEYSISGFEIL